MDKDIQEMFRQKNKEILIHNLKLDLERNMDVLINSLNNIFDLQFETAIKNILMMYNGNVFDKDIMKILIPLKSKSFIIINNAIELKKGILVNKINVLDFVESQMEEYYKLVFSTTQDIIKLFDSDEICDLEKAAILNLQELAVSSLDDINSNVVQYRIRDYIVERLFGKIKDKVNSEFLIRDTNLSNKGKESYYKFQELEEKTTNL